MSRAILMCAATLLLVACDVSKGDSGAVWSFESQYFQTAVISMPYHAEIEFRGQSGQVQVSVEEGELPPGMRISGRAIVGVPTVTGTWHVRLKASDGRRVAISKEFSLLVLPLPLDVTPATIPDAYLDEPYHVVLSAYGGHLTTYEWELDSILPWGLQFIPDSPAPGFAEIVGTPTLRSSYQLRLTVSSPPQGEGVYKVTNSTFYTQRLNVVPQPLRMDVASFPVGIEGDFYYAFPEPGGGVPPYTMRLDHGTLPPGVTMTDHNGLHFPVGTPTQAGQYQFGILLEDSEGAFAVFNYSIEILSPTGALAVRNLELGDYAVGVDVDEELLAVGGTGTGDVWTVAAGALPPGLSLSQMPTPRITGVPTGTGEYPVTLEVTDSGQNLASRDYVLRVFETPKIAGVPVRESAVFLFPVYFPTYRSDATTLFRETFFPLLWSLPKTFEFDLGAFRLYNPHQPIPDPVMYANGMLVPATRYYKLAATLWYEAEPGGRTWVFSKVKESLEHATGQYPSSLRNMFLFDNFSPTTGHTTAVEDIGAETPAHFAHFTDCTFHAVGILLKPEAVLAYTQIANALGGSYIDLR